MRFFIPNKYKAFVNRWFRLWTKLFLLYPTNFPWRKVIPDLLVKRERGFKISSIHKTHTRFKLFESAQKGIKKTRELQVKKPARVEKLVKSFTQVRQGGHNVNWHLFTTVPFLSFVSLLCFSVNDRFKRSTPHHRKPRSATPPYKYLEAALVVPQHFVDKYGANRFDTVLLVIANMVNIF